MGALEIRVSVPSRTVFCDFSSRAAAEPCEFPARGVGQAASLPQESPRGRVQSLQRHHRQGGTLVCCCNLSIWNSDESYCHLILLSNLYDI